MVIYCLVKLSLRNGSIMKMAMWPSFYFHLIIDARYMHFAFFFFFGITMASC